MHQRIGNRLRSISQRLRRAVPAVAFPVLLYLGWTAAIAVFELIVQPCAVNCVRSFNPLAVFARADDTWISTWDSRLFTDIALHGYRYPLQVFFPLWPLILRAVTAIGIPAVTGVHIVLLLLGAACFTLFYLLAVDLYGALYARYALLMFAVFPLTIILLAGYSEALYLTLILAAAFLIRRRRAAAAAIAVALAGATRMNGVTAVLLFLGLRIPVRKQLWYAVIGVSGLLLYALYLQVTFADGLLFFKGQQEWCRLRHTCGMTLPVNPIATVTNAVRELGTARIIPGSVNLRPLDLTVTVFALLMLVPLFAPGTMTYFLFSLTNILLVLATGSVSGMTRYIVTVFPIFLILPGIIRGRRIRLIILITSFATQLVFVRHFLRGGFPG